MKVNTISLFMLFILLTSCHPDGSSAGKIRNKEADQAFLHTLGENMFASITDITERQRKPSNQWLLNTHYPLSAQELEALKSVEDQEGSFATELADEVICSVASIRLLDETGAEVALGDTTQNPIYLQRFGLWDHDGQLSQNLGIRILTMSTFSTLTGSMQIQLEMESGAVEVVDVPVQISISDVL